MADLKYEGFFDKVRGKLRTIWGEITDDDVDKAHGNVETLIGTIKEKTGQAEDDIRHKLDDLGEREGYNGEKLYTGSRM
jgi:uncharacterized protein YjbJ (UPF0337 family)